MLIRIEKNTHPDAWYRGMEGAILEVTDTKPHICLSYGDMRAVDTRDFTVCSKDTESCKSILVLDVLGRRRRVQLVEHVEQLHSGYARYMPMNVIAHTCPTGRVFWDGEQIVVGQPVDFNIEGWKLVCVSSDNTVALLTKADGSMCLYDGIWASSTTSGPVVCFGSYVGYNNRIYLEDDHAA